MHHWKKFFLRRPQNGWQKAIKSASGAIIPFRSNLFYQKFLNKGRLLLTLLAAYPTPRLRRSALASRQNPQKFSFIFF
jgi:hypothetical protein